MDSWTGNFGKNFKENGMLTNEIMQRKNTGTGGAYQAEVSGMYGEFTIASVFKSLPDEYDIMNDILIQTGVQYKRYSIQEYQMNGTPVFDLYLRTGKQEYKKLEKEVGIQMILRGQPIYEGIKKSSQIDHMIVSPYGIFVIETKNHKGFIFGDMQSRVWTQVLKGEKGGNVYGNKSHYTFLNPVLQNELHLQHLNKEWKIPREVMTGMVVFTSPDADLSNVNCPCCYRVDTLAMAILSYQKQIFTLEKKDRIVEMIDKRNSSSYLAGKEHVNYVKTKQKRNN